MLSQKRAVPLLILEDNVERECGRTVQLGNIEAARAVADIVRTCLGPRAMLKMLVDTMGGTVITNDGNAVLREVAVKHPAANSMIEISRTQDQETGDGTTSVIVLASEVLSTMEPFLKEDIHPITLIKALQRALDDILAYCKNKLSVPIDVNNEKELLPVLRSCLGTKVSARCMDMIVGMSVEAVRMVTVNMPDGSKDIDIKRFVRIEKVPGGMVEDSTLVRGVVLNKDVVHPKMRRTIHNPRVVIIDSGLEFHKPQSQSGFHSITASSMAAMLNFEENVIRSMCDAIIKHKPDLVFCEKGVSDLAQHFLVAANISVIRRIKKTDSDRLVRVCGGKVVNDLDDLEENCVGTKATLFNIQKIGDEYFTFVTSGEEAKACTLLLRGPSKDIINELERNLHDGLCVARNVFINPRVVPGGGATEMALAQCLKDKSQQVANEQHFPYKAIADALEVIPKTLLQNSGAEVIRRMATLRAKHAQPGNEYCGVNGESGDIVDVKSLELWDPITVRVQVFKTAIETAILLLRIDDIVSGMGKAKENAEMNE